MTNRQRMLERWRPGIDVKDLAREIDSRCRIESYLYTDYLNIVFSDGSKITFTKGTLK